MSVKTLVGLPYHTGLVRTQILFSFGNCQYICTYQLALVW